MRDGKDSVAPGVEPQGGEGGERPLPDAHQGPAGESPTPISGGTSGGRRWLDFVVVVMAVLLVACGSGDTAGGAAEDNDTGPTIVATTAILGDVVENIVGDRATVEVIMPVGADPHEFQPSSQQLATIAGADLVVAVGLGLEESLVDMLAATAAAGTTVLELGPQLDPVERPEMGLDPHLWLDPERMATATGLIAEALAEVVGTVDWHTAAADYAAELRAADTEIAETLSAVPQDRRKLITNHDAVRYFADRYDFEVVGVIIPGGGTLAEPSSADLAALAAVITAEGVTAIFGETTEPTTLAEAVAAETGTEVEVVELFVESPGEPGSGADTLIGMLLTNARLIADALS